jgi:hypothetical protein
LPEEAEHGLDGGRFCLGIDWPSQWFGDSGHRSNQALQR